MTCGWCGSEQVSVLGQLGGRAHFRCVECGNDSSEVLEQSSSTWKKGRRMYALLTGVHPSDSGARRDVASVGEVVEVEVPENCTIHDEDARTLARIIDIANWIGELVRQRMINTPRSSDAIMLRELEQLTRPR